MTAGPSIDPALFLHECWPPRWVRMSASRWVQTGLDDQGPGPGFGAGPW